MQYEDIALSFGKEYSVIIVITVFNYSYEIQGKMTSNQVQGDIKAIRCYFFAKNEDVNTVSKMICVCVVITSLMYCCKINMVYPSCCAYVASCSFSIVLKS